MADLNEMEKEFLMGFIFCPERCWLPDEYKPVMKKLNVWGRNVLSDSQKDRLLAQPKFRTRGCTFFTGADIKKLRME
jgi:hypothetical protein